MMSESSYNYEMRMKILNWEKNHLVIYVNIQNEHFHNHKRFDEGLLKAKLYKEGRSENEVI